MNDCYAIGFKELKVIVRFLKSQELLGSDDLEYPGIFPEICEVFQSIGNVQESFVPRNVNNQQTDMYSITFSRNYLLVSRLDTYR